MSEEYKDILDLIKRAEPYINIWVHRALSGKKIDLKDKKLLDNLSTSYYYVDDALKILFEIALKNPFLVDVHDAIISLLYFELIKVEIDLGQYDEALKRIYEASRRIKKIRELIKPIEKDIKLSIETGSKIKLSYGIKVFVILLSMKILLDYAESKVKKLV